MKYPATLLCDFYKTSHRQQYPQGTEKIYSTWTARTSRKEGIDKVVCFGIQGFIKEYLIDYFNENFFNRPIEEVVEEYRRVITYGLAVKDPDCNHIEALHKLGYLPIRINALEEGTKVPIRVPMLTIENTIAEFFWVTNYLETLMSCMLWQPMTSATISYEYRKILDKYAEITGCHDSSVVDFQGHDFSMRGMSSLESASISGAGHLLSFVGTDTIPAIMYLEKNYGANIEKELVGTSISATEHSVQCAYGQENELETYRRLITEVYPKGYVSIVSDTWDLWKVVTEYLPSLKSEILNREGKVVIRPDSGNPVEIICGTAEVINVDNIVENEKELKYLARDDAWEYFTETEEDRKTFYYQIKDKTYKAVCRAEYGTERGGYTDDKYYVLMDVEIEIEEWTLTPAEKGVIQLLWETFGGTTNLKGYRELNSHIGAIYGDAITLERCELICEKLANKGFASSNMVFGIGSYSFQMNTRDTFGFALKSTFAVVNGESRMLFKNPITDNGVKKSQKGRVFVHEHNGTLAYSDEIIEEHLIKGINMLQPVFIDGKLVREQTLTDIREKIKK